MNKPKNPIFVALDFSTVHEALSMAKQLYSVVGGFKIGTQFYLSLGPTIYDTIAALGLPIFLDLKLHETPSTVSDTVHH